MHPEDVRVRKACEADCLNIYRWRNNPDTRRYFHNSESISLSEHNDWFKKILSDNKRFSLLINEDANDTAFAVVRFDHLLNKRAEVSIYVVPSRRGLGLGEYALVASMNWARRHKGVRTVIAEIVPGNLASIRMFATVGFREANGLFIYDFESA